MTQLSRSAQNIFEILDELGIHGVVLVHKRYIILLEIVRREFPISLRSKE
jgi:hypothetical protein